MHTPLQVWKDIRKEFYSNSNDIVLGLTREQVVSPVSRTRRNQNGGDDINAAERKPLSNVLDSHHPFLHGNHGFPDGAKWQRFVIFGNPTHIKLLKYKSLDIFIDETFKCVPKPFYQCVIAMVHDAGTGKTMAMYTRILRQLLQ